MVRKSLFAINKTYFSFFKSKNLLLLARSSPFDMSHHIYYFQNLLYFHNIIISHHSTVPVTILLYISLLSPPHSIFTCCSLQIQSLKGNQWKPDKACQTDPVICESCVDFKEQIQGLMEEFTVVREKIRQSEIAIASKNKEIRQLSKQLQQQQPQQLRPSFQKVIDTQYSPLKQVLSIEYKWSLLSTK